MTLLLNHRNDIPILTVPKGRLTSARATELGEAMEQLAIQRTGVVLLDLTQVSATDAGALAVLYEVVSRSRATSALFGAKGKLARQFGQFGLDKVLPLAPSESTALALPEIRARQMSGLRTVILSSDHSSAMRGFHGLAPIALLDVLGAPLLDRIMADLTACGIRDLVLTPGHGGDRLIERYRHHAGRNLFFLNQGYRDGDHWVARTQGAQAVLARLDQDHAALDRDTLVLDGGMLSGLNHGRLLEIHRHSGAQLTLAVSTTGKTPLPGMGMAEDGRLVPHATPDKAGLRPVTWSGACILNRDALRSGLDLKGDMVDLIRRLLRDGALIATLSDSAPSFSAATPRGYFDLLAAILDGHTPWQPIGTRADGHWLGPDADLPRRTRIEGACYFSKGARVAPQAVLKGRCVVGRNVVIEDKTVLSDTVLLEGARLSSGAWAQSSILSRDWSLSHLSPLPQIPAPETLVPAAAHAESQIPLTRRLV